MSNRPPVEKGKWIKIAASNIDALVMYVCDEYISVGYYLNRAKAIKEEAIWDGEQWQFKDSGPNGSYLRGEDEAMVKRGPPRRA